MIHQLDINGRTKVETAILRLKTFEPPEGYFLAFSGGKDSVVIKALADMAEVKYDAHYHLTTVDPPELVHFIKTFDDVEIDIPRYSDGKPITMWNLIAKKKIPPTRLKRYCCAYLKEEGGRGRFVVTGVRKAESAKRANRAGLEVADKLTGDKEYLDPDNPNQEMIHICQAKARRHLNPIIDWTDEEVWEFIREYNIPYCKLYDEGFTRLGCIGCPLGTRQREEFERWPKYKAAYLRAFAKMLENRKKENIQTDAWKTPEEVMEWFLR